MLEVDVPHRGGLSGLAGVLDHPPGDVDADGLTAGCPPCDFDGRGTRPAADVENTFVAVDLDLFQEAGPVPLSGPLVAFDLREPPLRLAVPRRRHLLVRHGCCHRRLPV